MITKRKPKAILVNKKEEKINQLFQNYIVDMYKVAKSRLDNEDDIYDAIQETGYRLYINFEKINNMDRIKIWIIKVLINECNKVYRLRKKEIKLQEKILKEKQEERDFTNDNDIDFGILLKELKKEDRTILTLYYGSDFTTKEIASILNKNESTIRSKIKRAKDHIRARIEEERE